MRPPLTRPLRTLTFMILLFTASPASPLLAQEPAEVTAASDAARSTASEGNATGRGERVRGGVAREVEARPRPESYGMMLLKMCLALGVICAAAYLALRFGLRRFLPQNQQDGPISVLTRFPLEPRRSLMVVRVAGRHLLLSSTEAGVHLLTELGEEEASAFDPAAPSPAQKAPISKKFTLELDEPLQNPPEK